MLILQEVTEPHATNDEEDYSDMPPLEEQTTDDETTPRAPALHQSMLNSMRIASTSRHLWESVGLAAREEERDLLIPLYPAPKEEEKEDELHPLERAQTLVERLLKQSPAEKSSAFTELKLNTMAKEMVTDKKMNEKEHDVEHLHNESSEKKEEVKAPHLHILGCFRGPRKPLQRNFRIFFKSKRI